MTKPAAAPRVSIGTLVTNVKMEAWGPGKVLELSSTSGTVHFRDLPTGSQVRRIGVSYLAIASEQSDPTLDLVPLPNARSAGPARRKRATPRKTKKLAPPRLVEPPDDVPRDEPSIDPNE